MNIELSPIDFTPQEHLAASESSRRMFVARLENMQQSGDTWLTIAAVLALLNDCDMLAQQELLAARA